MDNRAARLPLAADPIRGREMMIRLHVPITQKTKIGTMRGGLKLVMRIEMENASTGHRYYEERWAEPSNAKPLCRPSNGYGQHAADWAEAIARARPPK